jgi:hypothetical protein
VATGVKIGGGLILGILLYAAYWIVSVGILKQTILGVLVIELIILCCFVIGESANYVRKRHSQSKWLQSKFYVPITYLVLLISGSLTLVALLYGHPYAIAISGLFGGLGLIALMAEREK